MMKEIKDDTNRNIYHVPRLVESVLSKDYTTQGKLQIQSNVYEITNAIFLKTRTKKSWYRKESAMTERLN